MSIAFIPTRKRASEVLAPESSVLVLILILAKFSEGMRMQTCSSRSSETLRSGSLDVDSETQRL